MANKIVNTFETGLVKVDNKTKQPKNSYSYALNTVPNDEITDRSSRTNERGFDEYIQLKEDPYNIIGHQWLGDEQYVFFIKDLEGHTAPFNEIWYVDIKEGIQELKYSNLGLNFKEGYPITSTYRTDYRNHRIIYWVDGLNDDRVIDIDNPDVLTLDLSMISMNSSEIKADVSVESEDGGGIIKSGQYFVAVAYKDENNYITGASNFTTPISISTDLYRKDEPINITTTRDFVYTKGSELDVPTNKSLVVNVSNIDTKYKSLIIYIIQVTDTTTKIYTTEDLTITGDTLSYEFDGVNIQEDTTITINDLVVSRINYYASNIINQKENRLIRGNLKTKESIINYQQIANNIQVSYDIEEELVSSPNITTDWSDAATSSMPDSYREHTSYKNYAITPKYLAETGNSLNISSKTFMRDEVYALGVSFELNDGTETDVFHIPGRLLNTFSDVTNGTGEYGRAFTNQLDWDNDVVNSNPRWLEMNTAIKRISGNNELAYWRSDDVYPDGYGYPTDGEQDINGKSYVRHHKMPSDVLEPIFRSDTIASATANKSYELYKRNLKLVVDNIVIPEEYSDLITKVRIHYVKRNYSNKSIVSKGLIYGMGGINGETRQSPQFNFLNDNIFFGTHYQFVSPDVDFNFKQFPISANKFKSGYVAKGYVTYFGFLTEDTNNYLVNSINSHLYYLNETNPPFTELLTGTTFYLENTIPTEDLYNRTIENIIFTDANSTISPLDSSTATILNLEGEEKGSVFNIPVAESGLYVVDEDYPELGYEYPEATHLYPRVNYDGSLTGSQSHLLDDIYYDSVIYGSLIRNNRRQYGNPNNLVYIDSGASIINNNSNVSVEVKNGDSFIDIQYTKKGYSANDIDPDYASLVLLSNGQYSINQKPIGQIVTNSYIAYFVETDLNIRLRNTDPNVPEANINYWPISSLDSSNKKESFEKKSLNNEYYNIYPSFNNTHLKEYFANTRLLIDFNNPESNKYENRLIYSDKQNYEDKTDNFRITRANNYKDLPMDRGQITQSFIKDDKFFVITRDALYNVYASNKTIQSLDNDNIVVGTGEFFALEPVELISIKGGFGGTSSKYSLSESPYGYLFVDRLKSKSILFGESLKDINVGGLNEDYTLNMYNQFKELELEDKFDNPILGPGIISIYDPRLHRLLITKKDYIGLEDVTNNYQGLFNPEQDYDIGDIVAKDGVLVEILDKVETFNPKWIGSNLQCILQDGYNNGLQTYTNLVKVSDDINEYPLDVNNVRTTVSGLPQDSKLNTPEDPNYIPPVENLTACPITASITISNTDTNISDPFRLFVDTNITVYIDDVKTEELFSTGTIVLYVDRGKEVRLEQTSGYSSAPWPPNSQSSMTVDHDSTELYNFTETNQTANIIDGLYSQLGSYTFEVLGGNYIVESIGSSTETTYRKYSIDVTSVVPDLGTLTHELEDNTTGNHRSTLPTINNTTTEFNVVDDSGTVDIITANSSGTNYTVRIQAVNETYDQTQTVNTGTTYTFTNIPKDYLTITVT